jgi:hypothetical protein
MQRRALGSAGSFLLSLLMLVAPAAAKNTTNTHVEPQVPSAAAHAGAFGAPTLAHRPALAVSRSENADGSSIVTITQPLSNAWHVKVGADIDVAAAPETTYAPEKPLPGATADMPSGAAFASLGLAPFATVDARVDPGGKQGTLGATLSHAVPLCDGVALTLRGRYAVSDMMASADGGTAPAPVLSNDQSVQLAIAATGTTLSAGVSADSSDPTTHDTLSADQKVFGPLHVTTAITDPGQPTADKRVTAGFKLAW